MPLYSGAREELDGAMSSTADTLDPSVVSWTPWAVWPASGFEVHDLSGHVGLTQIDDSNFKVLTGFRFSGVEAQDDLVRRLVKSGVSDAEAHRRVDDARSYPVGVEDETDMASIPRFVRWFENTYGRHTLAAIIHDRLIVSKQANAGALGSDVLADRFFREMMKASGVPLFKRWIMWAAVAMRTRWAAGGVRRLTLALWLTAAVVGVTTAIGSLFAAFGTGNLFGWSGWALIATSLVLTVTCAPLWGRQWGASVIAAITCPWLLPAIAVAAFGWVIYLAIEAVLDRVV
jgi:hypothetical protein